MRPPIIVTMGLLVGITVGSASAQEVPYFQSIKRLTNAEIAIQMIGSNRVYHRIEASAGLSNWTGRITAVSTSAVDYLDSGAPFAAQSFYRGVQLEGTNWLTGDHLSTTNGEVTIHPLTHAGMIISWNGITIYNDPTNKLLRSPLADLILLSHTHGDHFSQTAVATLLKPAGVILAPTAVYNALSADLKTRTTIMTNGASTSTLGIQVEAIPAYNYTSSNHPLGVGNGYVLNIADKRIYISGDTEDVPPMLNLTNIHVAFLAMNSYTMNISQAVHAVRSFRPLVAYPYHFSGTSQASLTSFKQQVMADPGIEVRMRNFD